MAGQMQEMNILLNEEFDPANIDKITIVHADKSVKAYLSSISTDGTSRRSSVPYTKSDV